jgi:DNA-binding transcriptional ArsR family regulator
MTIDDDADLLEADSLESEALNEFVGALMDGKLLEAGTSLLALQGFKQQAMECLADVLEGTASPGLFPWRLKIRMRQLGRPINKSIPKTTKATLETFYDVLSIKDVHKVAKFLRRSKNLSEAELNDLTLALAALFEAPGVANLPWRFSRSARRKGNPDDHPIIKGAWYFPARNLRRMVVAALVGARGKVDVAVGDVSKQLKERGIKLSKATIYKTLKRLRDFEAA